MKKLFNGFFVIIFVFVGCNKEQIDPADKFVGDYYYTLTAATFFETGEMKVIKGSSDKIFITRKDSIKRPFSVEGNKITEDAGQIMENVRLAEGGGWATFIENSSGNISNNEVLLSGIYTSPYWQTVSFELRATKK